MRFFISVFLGMFWVSFAWADCERLKMGGVDQYTPYYWQPSGAQAHDMRLEGALSQLIAKIGDSIGVPIDVGFVGPIARAQEELRLGNIDMMSGLFYTEERNQTMEFLHPPLAHSHSRAWVHKHSDITIDSIADLANYTGIAVTGYSFGDDFDTYLKEHLNVLRVRSIEQLVRLVASKRVDYMLYEELPGQLYIDFYNGSDLMMLPLELSTEGIHIALSKKSVCITDDLQQKITQALKRSVDENWLEPFIVEARREWMQEQAQH